MSVSLSAGKIPKLRPVVAQSVAIVAFFALIGLALVSSAQGIERLRVNSESPRYLADSSGNAVYLAGSFQNPYNLLTSAGHDFTSYFDSLVERNHNFTRMWAWEQSPWTYSQDGKVVFTAQPYQRTGPGTALDGGSKFDLTRFNEAYFEQLRSRIMAAGERGIYVSVILFEGFSSQRRVRQVNPWLADPFHRDNNINNINADPNGNGRGEEFFSLNDPSLRALQEAFVRKLVDTLNDLDNVLYEVSGDTLATSLTWQFYMIDYLKSYQTTKPRQHPVGISQFYPRRVQEVMNSKADWVLFSTSDENPEIATGDKVIFLEGTRALFRSNHPVQWVWKAFTRGYNLIYTVSTAPSAHIEEKVQTAIGQTKAYASFLPLKSMLPSTAVCSTGFCLTNRTSDYLVYLPAAGNVSVDLATSGARYLTSWFDPADGQTVSGNVIAGGKQMLASPLRGDSVLQILPDSRLTSFTSGAASGVSSPRSGNGTEVSSDRATEGTVSKPVITPNGGVYSGSVRISMSTTTRGATIYYTTDGQTPTLLSRRYNGAFTLSSSTLVKAKAFKGNMTASAEAGAWFSNSSNAVSGFSYTLANSGNISLTAGSAASTTISATLSSGNSNTVSLAASGMPSGATASFSTTSCSSSCSSTLTIATAGATPPGSYPITVAGTANGVTKTTSFTLSVAAAATVATPTISPNGGNFSDSVSVSITTSTAGAAIYYTTNGTAPTQSSTLYNGPITVSSSATLKAKAFKSGLTPSNEVSAPFTKTSTSSSGLVAHWKFEEGTGTTVADASGNNLSGTLINGAIWTEGRMGKALFFDGIDDHVTVPHSNSLNLSNSFTISAWVNPATSFSDFRSVLVKNYKYYLYASVAGYCADSGVLAGFDATTPQVACDASALATNTWTHIVAVKNGSTLTLYRDGIAVANTNVSTTPSSSTGTLQIGASQWGEHFKGLIDEVRIYNQALDTAQVQAIYQQESTEPSQTVAAPIISPSGGSYTAPVAVTLQTATSGASIHYTTNGSTPTQSSPIYSGPITLTSTATLKAKAFKTGLAASPEASGSFTIVQPFNFSLTSSGNQSVVAGSSAMNSISASLGSGTSQAVSFSASGLPAGATATFSSNSCSPNCSSTLTVSISASTPAGNYPITVAGAAGGLTKTTTFTLSVTAASTVATPTISPNGGNFTGTVSVTLATATTGASIYYTTNGTSPTQSSTLYTGQITLTGSTVFKAKAFKSGSTSSAEASASFTQSSTGSTSGLVAHWKFDEGTGTTVADASGNNNSGKLTHGPLWTVGRKGNALYFDGIDDHVTVLHSDSLNLSGAFTLSAWVNPASAFSDFRSVLVKNYKYYLYASVAGYCGDGSPLAGFDAAAAQVVCDSSPLSMNTWTQLVLVGNGSTLTLYRDGIAVANSNVSGTQTSSTGTLQIGASQWGEYFKGLIDEVRMYNRALNDSEVQAIYAQEAVEPSGAVATPIVSPAGGTFNGAVNVTLQTATSGASIYYTTNGSTPSQSSTLYTGPIAVTNSATVKAKAFKTGLTSSAEASASFAVVQPFSFSLANSGNKSVIVGSSVTNSLSASLASGSSQPVSFSISGLPSGATASFSSTSCSPTCTPLLTITTSGSTPAGDFPISVTASGGGVTRTTAFTLSVTLALTVGTPTITPNGGSFSSSAAVTIQSATSGAAIYYTTDGLTPTQTSNLYSGSLSVTADTTIKAKAFKSGQNPSAVASASFSVTNTTGNTYYVSTSGSDSASCTTARNIGTPKRTISQALACLSAGDTLYIRGGTYDEQIQDRTTFGTATRPITIAGYPGDSRPVVRPGPSTGNTSLSVWWVAYGDRVARYLTIKGIEFDQGLQGPEYTGGCITIHGPDVTLDNVILRNCGRDGVGIKSKRITVRNSQIYNCGVHNPGLPNTDTKGLGFYANTDTLEQGDSRWAPGFGGEFIFENNIVDGCRGGGGVIHYMGTDNGIVRNNIFRNFGLSSPLSQTKPVGGGFQTTATGVNIGGDGVFGSPGPRYNRIYNNLFINITGDILASGHKLWGAQDNQIYNNTYYNVHYAYVVLCQSGNYSYAIKSNIWSNVHYQVNDTSTCGGELTATVSNNLLNPSVSSTFVDAANGNFSVIQGSTAATMGAGATPQ